MLSTNYGEPSFPIRCRIFFGWFFIFGIVFTTCFNVSCACKDLLQFKNDSFLLLYLFLVVSSFVLLRSAFTQNPPWDEDDFPFCLFVYLPFFYFCFTACLEIPFSKHSLFAKLIAVPVIVGLSAVGVRLYGLVLFGIARITEPLSYRIFRIMYRQD